jgi:hypothetical protein
MRMKRFCLLYRSCLDTRDSLLNICLELICLPILMIFILMAIFTFMAFLCLLFPGYISFYAECKATNISALEQIVDISAHCPINSSMIKECSRSHLPICYINALVICLAFIFIAGIVSFVIVVIMMLSELKRKTVLIGMCGVIGSIMFIGIQAYILEGVDQFPYVQPRLKTDWRSLSSSYFGWFGFDLLSLSLMVLCIFCCRRIRQETFDHLVQVNRLIDV